MRTHCGIGLVLSALVAAGVGGQPPAEFTRARPGLKKQLVDPNPAARAAAVEALRQFPTPAAAELVLPAVRDGDPAVSLAAVSALLHLGGDEKVAAWMRASVERDAPAGSAALAVVLLTAEAEDAKLTALLEKRYPAKAARAADLAPAAAELGVSKHPGAVRALRRLTRLPALPASEALKWAVADGLFSVREPEAVPGLIDLLEKSDGEVAHQVGAHLERVTGTIHDGAAAWRQWWETSGKTFRFPATLPNPPAPPKAQEGSYYGIPIRAKRVVFVVDCSGSMAGTRIASARTELARAIQQLQPGTEFNIVAFNTSVFPWQARPVALTEANRKSALATANGLIAAGGTSTYDALSAALAANPQAIYLMTDGAPSSGTIVQTDAILAAVRARNRVIGCTVHTIGIGLGPEASFLEALARQNHGQYRAVE